MYNFFSNKLKYKAFVKALKQVEAEGFYANLEIDENTKPILPDLSQEVASLSRKKIRKEKPQAEAVDISSLESDLDRQRATADRVQPKLDRRFAGDNFRDKHQTDSEFYKNLFKPSDSFLSGENISDSDFLSGRPTTYTTKPKLDEMEEPEDNSKFESKLQAFSELTQRSKAIREAREQRRLELERQEDSIEIPPIEADIEMPEMEQESESQPEAPKVTVEVVADIPKPEPPKTITKTVYVTKEVPVPVEVPAPPKPKVKKSTTPRKKKRKYDADISGGFNY